MTDVTCDLDPVLLKQYDITTVPMPFILDGVERTHYSDWREMSLEDFYTTELKKSKSCSTAGASEYLFETMFREKLEEGEDVLFVSFSSAISVSYANSFRVVKTLAEEFPERKIRCVDSLMTAMGLGKLMIEAAEKLNNGEDIDAVCAWIEHIKNKLHASVAVRDIRQLVKGGRADASLKTWAARIIGTRVILWMNPEGNLESRKDKKGEPENIRGYKASNALLVRYMRENEDAECPLMSQLITISHSDDLRAAEHLRDLIVEEFGVDADSILIKSLSAIVGVHTGSGTIAVFYYGKEKV